MTNIELDDVQALAFRLLSEAGAWDLKKGSATIHFDAQGLPNAVEVRSFTFSGVIHRDGDSKGLTVVI